MRVDLRELWAQADKLDDDEAVQCLVQAHDEYDAHGDRDAAARCLRRATLRRTRSGDFADALRLVEMLAAETDDVEDILVAGIVCEWLGLDGTSRDQFELARRDATSPQLEVMATSLLTIHGNPQPLDDSESTAAAVALARAYVAMNLNADALAVIVNAMWRAPRSYDAFAFAIEGIWEGKFHSRDSML